MLGFAQHAQLVARNVLREQRRRHSAADREAEEIVIPSKEDLRAILADQEAPLWFRVFVAAAIYTGMRASELRGLDWQFVDRERGVVRVRQRADFAGTIGRPKSRAGNGDIPMTLAVKKLFAELHLAQGRPVDGLVFATAGGKPHTHGNLRKRLWLPLQERLGLDARYGLHSLRHAAASLFIEQGWTAKKVQVTMGHSSIQVTFDVYGKLFPDSAGDDAAMARLEASLQG